MGYIPNVLRAVNYMERHLRDAISVDDVAAEAAYSSFHFIRLFRAVTGDTPGNYLRNRRLTEAARELVLTRRRIIDIALDYQFGSPEAFCRAFRESAGMSPSRYRRAPGGAMRCVTRPISELYLIHLKEGISMEPRIERRGALSLVGLMYYGENKNNEIPAVWNEFMPYLCATPGQVPNRTPDRESFGLCFYTGSFAATGFFYYLAAVPVTKLDEIPMPLVGKTIPAAEYAVFSHRGPVAGLKQLYGYAYGTWLPSSGYENPYNYDFEYYGKDFAGDGPDALTEIWIPVKRQA